MTCGDRNTDSSPSSTSNNDIQTDGSENETTSTSNEQRQRPSPRTTYHDPNISLDSDSNIFPMTALNSQRSPIGFNNLRSFRVHASPSTSPRLSLPVTVPSPRRQNSRRHGRPSRRDFLQDILEEALEIFDRDDNGPESKQWGDNGRSLGKADELGSRFRRNDDDDESDPSFLQ